jgi:ABC-2 type transport system permease protein
MSLARMLMVAREDLKELRGRPLLWIWLFILGLTAFGLSHGEVRISSGDAAVGGTKAWITSEFAQGQTFAMVGLLLYAFFVSVLAGMAVIRDDELKVGEVLHATPLLPGEYVWGKYLATLVGSFAVLAAHLAVTMLIYQLLPLDNADELRGPFALAHYVRPALIFAVPLILVVSGAAFLVGTWSRRPLLVFVLPVALLLFGAMFLWNWSPSWLDPRINRLLMLIEPAGFRWLNETWLKVDQGVDFYNKSPIPLDSGFIVSRGILGVLALSCVAIAQRHFQRTLRGVHAVRAAGRARQAPGAARLARLRWPAGLMRPRARRPASDTAGPGTGYVAGSLRALRMQSHAPGLITGIVDVARFELKELGSSPGLYLFVPIILLQILGTSLLALGAFDTPVLITSGTAAVRSMNTIALLVAFLLLFYTVESLQREWSTGLAPIYHTTAARTASMLFGKAVANTLVGVVIVFATFLGCAVAILIQGKVAVQPGPFLLVWGLLLIPTFLVWSSFVGAVFALTRNRYTAYGIGLGALALTGYLQTTGRMSWAGNWDLWGTLLWSDMGPLQLDRPALAWNRVLALALTVLFTAITVRAFPRREEDATRIVHRIAPGRAARSALRLLPYAVVPLVAIVVLVVQVRSGFQGPAVRKKEHDYWKQNLATWKDAPLPAVRFAEIDLQLEPRRHWFKVSGAYHVWNHRDALLRSVPLTGGLHWESVSWTLDGADYTPEDRTHLYVFTPPRPLAHGDSLTIGFSYEGRVPRGATRNGGGLPEFILPSGVVLTSFRPTFVPLLGYDEEVGIEEKKNRYEPKVYPDDFYQAVLEPAFGSQIPMRTRIRISGPAEYAYNSVGTLTHEEVSGGRRTVVWESDHPVRFFNVVAGRWKTRVGNGTRICYDPRHAYNVEEMSRALDAARLYYSRWFRPYPWQELKLSEFPALAFYAQGFPTNITFSEGIGFLTKSDPRTELAFLVTAHESAHQWWGNLLTPGKGPGGDILSEGMSHFSTLLLMQQVLGERERIEMCKRIEERYGDRRQADSERPLVKIDGSRPGDVTVTYDKGGWVMWMLDRLMGRDAMLAGLQEFMTRFSDGPDYPVLQDLVATLRPHAPDPAAYDAFVQQWFFQVVVPEYRITQAGRTKLAAHDAGAATQGPLWEVTARVKNRGTGAMPVQIAATRGERFPKPAAARARQEPAPSAPPAQGAQPGSGEQPVPATLPASGVSTAGVGAAPGAPPAEPPKAARIGLTTSGSPAEPFAEQRATVTLGPGEEQEIVLRCAFEPQQLVVDPDALVLQLKRKSAVHRF